jgi:hypothetical protein
MANSGAQYRRARAGAQTRTHPHVWLAPGVRWERGQRGRPRFVWRRSAETAAFRSRVRGHESRGFGPALGSSVAASTLGPFLLERAVVGIPDGLSDLTLRDTGELACSERYSHCTEKQGARLAVVCLCGSTGLADEREAVAHCGERSGSAVRPAHLIAENAHQPVHRSRFLSAPLFAYKSFPGQESAPSWSGPRAISIAAPAHLVRSSCFFSRSSSR